MLRFNQLTLRRGTKCLFEGADFTIHPGQRVGITGANGTGKSSLFALIKGDLQADNGDFHKPSKWVLAHVAQQTPSSSRPAIEYVLDGDERLREVQQKLAIAEEAGDGQASAELYAQLEAEGGYTANSRAATLLHGLGFAPGEENRPVDSFSGGWRMRLNLAKALMCRSDLLLLDEPTNHLDLEAVIWLESWLRSYQGTLLLISHDRDFLDAVIDQIAHIERGEVTLYSGNYTAFERIRSERLAQQQAAFEKQQREVAHIKQFVDRFKAKATKARQAQSRLKALERMEQIAPAHVDSPFHFEFRKPDKNPNPLLQLEKAEMGYDDKVILSLGHLVINAGDRIGLLGHNGAGKSTLIRALANEQPLLAGKKAEAQDLKIGYFAQHQLEQLHPQHTPLEHMLQLDKQASDQSLRDYLGGFGFIGDRVNEPTAPFSGGEKARLVLALLVYQKPNLLLLDEPTNHLDLEMRQALALALQMFEGAMVLVSHDRHLLRSTADRLWLVHDGKVDDFPDSVDDYPSWLAKQQAESAVSETSSVSQENSAAARKERKRIEAEQRKKVQPLTKRLNALEKQLDKLSEEKDELEAKLAEPDIYADENKKELKTLLARKGEVDQQLEQVEEEWMTVGEEIEAMKSDMNV